LACGIYNPAAADALDHQAGIFNVQELSKRGSLARRVD
jgi:hypothetical protein